MGVARARSRPDCGDVPSEALVLPSPASSSFRADREDVSCDACVSTPHRVVARGVARARSRPDCGGVSSGALVLPPPRPPILLFSQQIVRIPRAGRAFYRRQFPFPLAATRSTCGLAAFVFQAAQAVSSGVACGPYVARPGLDRSFGHNEFCAGFGGLAQRLPSVLRAGRTGALQVPPPRAQRCRVAPRPRSSGNRDSSIVLEEIWRVVREGVS